MKVFITRELPPEGLKLLQGTGWELSFWLEKRELTPEELNAGYKGCDALLSAGMNKLGKDFFAANPSLKVVSLHSVGFDNVDREAATAAGIPVGNTPGVLSEATADTALLLAVARRAFDLHKSIKRGEWRFFEPMGKLGFDIEGKTLGIFGLGSIGYELARRCRSAFGMKIIYHNRSRNEKAERELGAVYVSFDELLAGSDVLSVHTALTPETKGTFDAKAFARMKPGAVFINTARGGIHNETDLIEALEKNIIWGAGLDVTNPEPMRPDNPLLEMPTVAVLPHIGSGTIETRNGMALLAANNIISGLKGERIPHCINPEVYDRSSR